MQSNMPTWLHNIIAEQIQSLLLLGLEGHPPFEATQHVVRAWQECLADHNITWNQEQDAARVLKAFKTLRVNSARWPSPKAFYDALEPRKPAADVLALPGGRERKRPEDMTPEERAEHIAAAKAVREQLAALANKMKMPGA